MCRPTFWSLLHLFLAAGSALALAGPARSQQMTAPAPESECMAWTNQGGPQTDRTGLRNTNFPEASTTTYWTTTLRAPIGSIVTIHGRFPLARFTALEIYSADQLVDHLNDVDIVPDPGQNNPYVSGTDNGTYTMSLVFGQKPSNAPPNTLYTGTLTSTVLMYRIYHATDRGDPAGGARNPVLPRLAMNGQPMASCKVRPFIEDQDSTPWGRLDNGDWIGTPPTEAQRLRAFDPPLWSIADPYAGSYFPNGANFYMAARLSREYLHPHTDKTLYVVRFKAPTYPRTRSGEPVYADRQVHFWSLCTDDPYTTNVNRCIPDDETVLDPEGFATFVVSDPGARPSNAALATFHANWLPWGALHLPTDVVYDRARQPWGIDTPVHFYNGLMYRQTLAAPSFTQSFVSVFQLPRDQWQAAMGPYWPVGGYCSTHDFNTFGMGCLGR